MNNQEIDSAILHIRNILDEYRLIEGTHNEFMSIHDLSKNLNWRIVQLAAEMMEIDKIYTDLYADYITKIRNEKQRLLDENIYTAVNRAEAKAQQTYVDIKAKTIRYERSYNRLKFFIQMASDVRQDMRSFISSLKKEKEYDQYTNKDP